MTDPSTVYAVRGAPREEVQPFACDRGPIGCVLLHGFTAAPKEMRPLGVYLAERDYTIRGVRLAGHATSPQDLARTTWRDWVNSARVALAELRDRCAQVWSIGLSLGGLIGLYLAEQAEVDGVVAMAPPIFTLDKRLPLARFIWPFKPYSVKSLADLHDPQALAEHADYALNPTRSAARLYSRVLRPHLDLASVCAPLLLIGSRHDRVVPIEALDYIFERVAAIDKDKLVLERGGHIVTEDYDKEVAFARIDQFLRRHIQ